MTNATRYETKSQGVPGDVNPFAAGGFSGKPKASEKSRLFDQYWESRNLRSVDERTRRRVALIEEMLTDTPGRLLDVGCGRGTVAAHFAEHGWNVSASDVSPLALEWTSRNCPSVRTVLCDLEQDFVSDEYDTVLCLEVLQQVRQPTEVLKRLSDAVRPGGSLIVSLPNEYHLQRRLSVLFGRVDFGGIEDTHIKLYSVSEHKRLFAACGLSICDSRVQSIIPPRWFDGRAHIAGNVLAGLLPGLFALSVIYSLKPSVELGE
jgi:SAM-dependent methyltransferase